MALYHPLISTDFVQHTLSLSRYRIVFVLFFEAKRLTLPQLDIVFPASDELEKALTSLKPTYCKRRCTLVEFLDFASKSPGG